MWGENTLDVIDSELLDMTQLFMTKMQPENFLMSKLLAKIDYLLSIDV